MINVANSASWQLPVKAWVMQKPDLRVIAIHWSVPNVIESASLI